MKTMIANPELADLDSIPGWFFPADRHLFDWLLGRSSAPIGDLVELGAYMGKSAVFMGRYLRAGETFTVCDLFDAPAPDAATGAEMQTYYKTLTRTAFENNYLSRHAELPVIVEGPSSTITSHVEPDTCRFVHIDASHLYPHVKGDIEAARLMLGPGGVVAVDDYRSPHTPDVAAATWEAVINGGLKPIMVSESKFYGTWDDADAFQKPLLEWLAGHPVLWAALEEVAGQPLVRVHQR